MGWVFCVNSTNSMWPGDTIWRRRSGSTLVQVMACCLTAPSHYLNQCWLIINEVQWQSPKGNHNVHKRYLGHQKLNYLEIYLYKISLWSPRGEWVKTGSHAPLSRPITTSNLTYLNVQSPGCPCGTPSHDATRRHHRHASGHSRPPPPQSRKHSHPYVRDTLYRWSLTKIHN